jgi:MoaA/NifB/PqqE/SkfB family radical SAM enzyme
VHLLEPCNQNCIMCLPVGKFGKGVLPFERFEALVEEIRPVAEHVTLIGGEPLMYPRIADALDLLAQHPIEVSINTNATLLSERLIPHLLGLHALNLKCSIDAATAETYHRIRGRDTFDRAVGNVRAFAAAAERPELRVVLVYVVMRENLGEALDYLDLAVDIGAARVEFHPVRLVRDWHVSNGTGWTFDGKEQSCEDFAEEYNDVMRATAAKAERLGIECETLLL